MAGLLQALVSENFSNLPLSNDFMFSEVMRQEEICTLFLEELLQMPIAQIKYINKQADLTDSKSWHGIRLDVYIRDENNTVYNIEMQTTNGDDLERRARFYQAGIDRQTLAKGQKYKTMPESFIIFVCNFDYFEAGLPVYKRMSCIETREDIIYDDGSRVYFLNSKFTDPGDTPNAIIEFLHCIETNDLACGYQSELMRAVCPAIKEVRNNEEKEVYYMTWLEKCEQFHEEGRKEEKRAVIIRMGHNGDKVSHIMDMADASEKFVLQVLEEEKIKPIF